MEVGGREEIGQRDFTQYRIRYGIHTCSEAQLLWKAGL